MTLLFSEPFEAWVAKGTEGRHVDTLIVGSGYGAALATLALAMRKDAGQRKILVMERGNEFVPGDFPKTLSDLPSHVSTLGNEEFRTGYADALFDVRVGENVVAIVGSGLGGTSLINAGVAVDPSNAILEQWPKPQGPGRSWLPRLQPSLAFVRQLLKVQRHPNAAALKKVVALKRLCTGIAKSGTEAVHDRADIAVNFDTVPNNVGVQQAECNDCGNCFTGCNIGAKSTLAMNAWPLAKRLGVDIVTGGSVDSVRKGDSAQPGWHVAVRPTTDPMASPITIVARRVILAAGTFGSTEILHRSAILGLPVSRTLGSEFSLNGDGIAFGFGQSTEVDAYAKVPSADHVVPKPDQKPGPTIVSMIRIGDPAQRGRFHGLIEDATVPQPIARLWAEVLSTQAMANNYVSDVRSAWHRNNPGADPLAVSTDLMNHHQVVLTMGADATSGSLPYEPRYQHLQLKWPERNPRRSANAAPDRFDEIFNSATREKGFDGGLHLANPFWKPLPKQFNTVFEGAGDLGGTQLCNHPLGGCVMGKNAVSGVVDTLGRVFDTTGGVHEGLYVLDGAIIPSSLGINPYMTIASLAHYLALQIDGGADEYSYTLPAPVPQLIPHKSGQIVEWPVTALPFEFKERLFNSASDTGAAAIAAMLGLPASSDHHKQIVIDATIKFPDLYQWLKDPSQPLDTVFEVRQNKRTQDTLDTIPNEFLDAPLGKCIEGRVWLLARDEASFDARARGNLAIDRFLALRGDEIAPWQRPFIRIWPPFVRVAKQHAHWRYLRYDFKLQLGSETIQIHGEKRLAYDGSRSRQQRDESNPWVTLGNIEFTFKTSQRKHSTWFRVDLVRMARNLDPLQSVRLAETPQVAGAVAGFGGLLLRALIQTHLWSFGAPDYGKFPKRAAEAARVKLYEPPQHIRYAADSGIKQFPVTVEHVPADAMTNPAGHWRLIKALPSTPPAEPRLPILLIHGISHSSRVFYPDSLDRNLAGYLLNEGHEVWMLDHGLSTALRHSTDYRPYLDDISPHIAAAIKHVHDASTSRPADKGILVFAHCIGAAALTMAVLDGKVDMTGHKSRIETLVMHAVPPWIYASESNLLRAYVGVFLRARFFPDSIDPIPLPTNESEAPGTMLDRVASTFPWTQAEFGEHNSEDRHGRFARTICNRMTFFYGYEWLHANLDPRIHKEFFSLFGPANSNAYRQLYFLVNRGRVTDKEGQNAFVQLDKLIKHWTFPTMFLHGRQNEAFDVESAKLSAARLMELNNHPIIKGKSRPPVGLCIVDGYGHLDTLLGKQAWQKVFKPAHEFLLKPVPGPLEKPKSVVQGWSTPATGPIISHPQVVQGADGVARHLLRIWFETNEFQASPVDDIKLSQNGVELHVTWHRPGSNPAARAGQRISNQPASSTFWLGDLDCEEIKGPVNTNVGNRKPDIGLHLKLVRNQAPGPQLEEKWRPKYVSAQIDIESKDTPAHINWSQLAWFERFVASGKADNSTRLSFVLGSCWYPGSWFDQHRADSVFARIQEHIKADDGIDHLMLVGDQIYADASYAIFDIAENRERFQQSYRRAFNSERAAWVLRHVPTYFAVDDHEFRDGYPKSQLSDVPPEPQTLGQAGAREAWNFQMHHARSAVPGGNHDNQLWYAFKSAGFDCFVFDTRSERVAGKHSLADILGPQQQQGFSAWAKQVAGTGRPLFLATGSSLAPVPTDEFTSPALAHRGDSLRAFPELIDFIARELTADGMNPSVIFLSGDPHYSSYCRFDVRTASSNQPLKVISIVSSGLNAPLPFANGRSDDISWGTAGTFCPVDSSVELHIIDSKLLSTSRNHALRIDVDLTNGARTMTIGVVAADTSDSNPLRVSIPL